MGCTRKKTPIYCGVPQGSILAPLLFLLYINNINKVSNIANLILFADDTNLFFSHNNLPFLIEQVNGELDKLTLWLSANKLSINLKKTNFMIFRPRQKKFHINPKIVLNSFEIDMVDEVSFLGVILDANLTWKSHISHVSRKMSKSMELLRKLVFVFRHDL